MLGAEARQPARPSGKEQERLPCQDQQAPPAVTGQLQQTLAGSGAPLQAGCGQGALRCGLNDQCPTCLITSLTWLRKVSDGVTVMLFLPTLAE